MSVQGFAYIRDGSKLGLEAKTTTEEMVRIIEGVFLGLDSTAQNRIMDDLKGFLSRTQVPGEIVCYIRDEVKKGRW